MEDRSRTRTVVEVFAAFFRKRRWVQSDLARELGVSVATVRNTLREMSEQDNIPFMCEHNANLVVWSLPRTWLPDAVNLPPKVLERLIRLVLRAPASKARDEVFRHLMSASYDDNHIVDDPYSQDPLCEEDILGRVEDATRHRSL